MHIGECIKKKLEEEGHSAAWFAERICCTRPHVYKIFRRSSIDTDLLKRISRVLNHDFFKDISVELHQKKQ